MNPLLLLAVARALPPKESGNWIDAVFNRCVEWLLALAAWLGISYNAVNVLVFCVVWPVLTLALLGLILHQRARIHRLTRRLPTRGLVE